jgi:serine/threonine protein kinase
MGAVYKARDNELDRLVALKIIRPELTTNPEILRRFKQDLILARQVTHRNVIRIFDLGQAPGFKFITMEYLDGKDLRAVLKEKGKLSPEEAGRIILQICRALEVAHGEGVVHRDLKPQNIMLDANGRAYVMDFGIARSAHLPGMTQTGALIGTPEYVSPEQAKGEKLDERSDLFSLGVIFYPLQFLTEAKNLVDIWLVHLDLGRAYLEARAFAEADSEFDVCIKRRGEALDLFTDDMPTYSYLPPVYYYQGQAREGLKSPGAADSFRTYLSIRGKAGEDPLLPEIRRRLGQ